MLRPMPQPLQHLAFYGDCGGSRNGIQTLSGSLRGVNPNAMEGLRMAISRTTTRRRAGPMESREAPLRRRLQEDEVAADDGGSNWGGRVEKRPRDCLQVFKDLNWKGRDGQIEQEEKQIRMER